MKEIAILIVGSRSYTDYDEFCKVMNHLLSHYLSEQITIISGRAKGADSLAERYAREQSTKLIVIPAEWEKYGKSAGYIRNEEMHKTLATHYPNRHVIAFWDGESRGTKHSFELAKKYQNPLVIWDTIHHCFK